MKYDDEYKKAALAAIKKPEVAEVLAIIKAKPQNHEQESWLESPVNLGVNYNGQAITAKNMCGTTACVAGWATLQDGYMFKFKESEDGWGYYDELHVKAPGHRNYVKHPDGFDFQAPASKRLGFDQNIGNNIFMDMDRDSVIAKLEAMLDGTYIYPEWEDRLDEY